MVSALEIWKKRLIFSLKDMFAELLLFASVSIISRPEFPSMICLIKKLESASQTQVTEI